MDDPKFLGSFGAEKRYRTTLVEAKWLEGYLCPFCGNRGHSNASKSRLFQCCRCNKQTSPTMRTLFHSTQLPLIIWLLATYPHAVFKNVISAMEPERRLAINPLMARIMKQKVLKEWQESRRSTTIGMETL